jgi:hypothetical protein
METTLKKFRKIYPKNVLKTYSCIYPKNGTGYAAYYYVAKEQGLTFMFGLQDSYDNTIKPEYLIIHRPNTFPIPDEWAELDNSNENMETPPKK